MDSDKRRETKISIYQSLAVKNTRDGDMTENTDRNRQEIFARVDVECAE